MKETISYLGIILLSALFSGCALRSSDDGDNTGFRNRCDGSGDCAAFEICNTVTNICVPRQAAGPNELNARFVCERQNDIPTQGYLSWNFGGQSEETDTGCFWLETQSGNIGYAFLPGRQSQQTGDTQNIVFFSFDANAGIGRQNISDDITIYIRDLDYTTVARAGSGYIEITAKDANRFEGLIEADLISALGPGEVCANDPAACGSFASNITCNTNEPNASCRLLCSISDRSRCSVSEACFFDAFGSRNLCLPYVCSQISCGAGLGCLDQDPYSASCVEARTFSGNFDITIRSDSTTSAGLVSVVGRGGAPWESLDVTSYLFRLTDSTVDLVRVDIPGSDGTELQVYIPAVYMSQLTDTSANFFEGQDFTALLYDPNSDLNIGSSISGTLRLSRYGSNVGNRLVGQIDVAVRADSSNSGVDIGSGVSNDAGVVVLVDSGVGGPPQDGGIILPEDAGEDVGIVPPFDDAGVTDNYSCLNVACEPGQGCLFDPQQPTDPICVPAGLFTGDFDVNVSLESGAAAGQGINTVVGLWSANGTAGLDTITVDGLEFFVITIAGSSSSVLEIYVLTDRVGQSGTRFEGIDFFAFLSDSNQNFIASSISGTLEVLPSTAQSFSATYSIYLEPINRGPAPPPSAIQQQPFKSVLRRIIDSRS